LTKQACFSAYSAALLIGGYGNMRKSLYSAEAEEGFSLVSEAESAGAPVSEAVKIYTAIKPAHRTDYS